MNTFGQPEDPKETLQIEKEKEDQALIELKEAIDAAGENAYLISEHLREGCTSCPFCYDRNLNFGVVDETHTGILKQQITCRDCEENWTIEYEASRVSYRSKWYSRYEYWPTYIQAKSMEYQDRLRSKYGLKHRPTVEDVKEKTAPVNRSSAIKRLINYAKSLNW